jgi:2-oxoisovalerate dehydrogenase E1 component alpha subunit
MKADIINGNDPLESYIKLKESMDYIRETGKPAFVEARLSRLYGHSSASGANFVDNEVDCLKNFEALLLKEGILTTQMKKEMFEKYEEEGVRAQEQVRNEPVPTSESIWEQVFVNNENSDWRKF